TGITLGTGITLRTWYPLRSSRASRPLRAAIALQRGDSLRADLLLGDCRVTQLCRPDAVPGQREGGVARAARRDHQCDGRNEERRAWTELAHAGPSCSVPISACPGASGAAPYLPEVKEVYPG